jgi:hypothetical protein
VPAANKNENIGKMCKMFSAKIKTKQFIFTYLLVKVKLLKNDKQINNFSNFENTLLIALNYYL